VQLYEQKYQAALQGFTIEQMGRRRRDEYQVVFLVYKNKDKEKTWL
jgi:hypothetical protein